MNPFRWIRNWMRFVGRLAWQVAMVPVNWFRGWLYFYNRLAISAFLIAWYESRGKWKLLWGIPVVTVFTSITIIFVQTWQTSSADQRIHTLTSAQSVLNRGDFERASLLFRRALIMEPNRRDALYGLAQTAQKSGDEPRYLELIYQLAEGHDEIAAKSNLEIVELLSKKKEEIDDRQRQEMIDRLEQVVAIQPGNIDARLRLGETYIALKQWKTALIHVQAAAYAKPVFYIRLAQLHLQAGNEDLANRSATAAADYFQKQLQQRPDDVQGRLGYSIALSLLKQFPQALNVLREGLLFGESQGLKSQFARTCVVWALDTEKNGDDSRVLFLLQEALKADPNNAEALGLLFRLSKQISEAGEQARIQLQERLARGDAPGVIHLLLGTSAAAQGDMESAERHLKRALALSPQSAKILNNLAWILSHQPEPDYEHALQFVNQALSIAPEFAEARETRGQILVVLQRWSEALTDLEFALPIYTARESLKPLVPSVHQALATCYENLGEEAMAKRHKSLVDESNNIKPANAQ